MAPISPSTTRRAVGPARSRLSRQSPSGSLVEGVPAGSFSLASPAGACLASSSRRRWIASRLSLVDWAVGLPATSVSRRRRASHEAASRAVPGPIPRSQLLGAFAARLQGGFDHRGQTRCPSQFLIETVLLDRVDRFGGRRSVDGPQGLPDRQIAEPRRVEGLLAAGSRIESLAGKNDVDPLRQPSRAERNLVLAAMGILVVAHGAAWDRRRRNAVDAQLDETISFGQVQRARRAAGRLQVEACQTVTRAVGPPRQSHVGQMDRRNAAELIFRDQDGLEPIVGGLVCRDRVGRLRRRAILPGNRDRLQAPGFPPKRRRLRSGGKDHQTPACLGTPKGNVRHADAIARQRAAHGELETVRHGCVGSEDQLRGGAGGLGSGEAHRGTDLIRAGPLRRDFEAEFVKDAAGDAEPNVNLRAVGLLAAEDSGRLLCLDVGLVGTQGDRHADGPLAVPDERLDEPPQDLLGRRDRRHLGFRESLGSRHVNQHRRPAKDRDARRSRLRALDLRDRHRDVSFARRRQMTLKQELARPGDRTGQKRFTVPSASRDQRATRSTPSSRTETFSISSATGAVTR